MNKPLVSILMTAFNAKDYVQKAVESVIGQTYDNWELIIVDDGSTDKTLEILTSLTRKDRRIKLYALAKNHGPSYASNYGLKHIRGQFLARMDADDISYPQRIEKQVKYLLSHPEVVILGGQCRLINEGGEVIGKKSFPLKHDDIYASLFSMNPIQHPSSMINTQLMGKRKLFYQDNFVLAHDLELVFRLSQFGKLANLKETVLDYRQHQDSLSLKNPKDTFKATFRVRKNAVKDYGFRPGLKGWVYCLMQALFVFLLPREAVYPLYRLIRLNRGDSLGKVIADTKRFVRFSFASRFSYLKADLATRLAE